jgi:hypothetical protein
MFYGMPANLEVEETANVGMKCRRIAISAILLEMVTDTKRHRFSKYNRPTAKSGQRKTAIRGGSAPS